MDHDRVNNNKSNESNRRVAAEAAESIPAATIPSSSSSSSTTSTTPSFWRTNSRALPGRPSLNRPLGPNTSSGLIMAHNNNNQHMKGSSFQTYQDSVSDAWDLGDDEFCIISGLSDTKISRRVSQSAAMNVIKTHRSGLSNNSQQQSTGNVAINNNHSSRSSTSTGAGDSLKEGSSTNNNHYRGAAATGTVSANESSSSSSTGTTNHQLSSLNDSQDTANENHPEESK